MPRQEGPEGPGASFAGQQPSQQQLRLETPGAQHEQREQCEQREQREQRDTGSAAKEQPGRGSAAIAAVAVSPPVAAGDCYDPPAAAAPANAAAAASAPGGSTQIQQILGGIRLPDDDAASLLARFLEEGMDDHDLRSVNHDDLKEVGMTQHFYRKRFLEECAKIR
jgi:hypothetical protein